MKEVHELVSDARTTQPRHAAQATPTSDEPAMRTPARPEDLTADVVVVGAGPAGASAAYHMARLGLDVLLLEKNELGRDKVCGDGLTPSAVSELALMGVDTTGWQRNEGLRVIGGGHMLHVPWPERPSLPSYGMARRRSQLDRDLAEHAAAAGARLLTGVTVTGAVTTQAGRVTGVEVKPTARVENPGVESPATVSAPLVVDAGVSGDPLAGARVHRGVGERGDLLERDAMTETDTRALVAAGEGIGAETAARTRYESASELAALAHALEKMSAGVAAQKAVRLNCKRASPLPITPLWASTNPTPMTTKIIANPVNTSSNSQQPFAVL